MENLLILSIVITGTWAALRLLQVRRLTVRYEQVRYRNVEQDRPFKG